LFWDEYFDVTNSSPTFQEFFFCIPVSNHAINSAVIALPQCQHTRLGRDAFQASGSFWLSTPYCVIVLTELITWRQAASGYGWPQTCQLV